ncbi:rho GTPase-activating protein 7-like isoform X2 [Babylonia areolata]|uniref:rho GTPase-activating protein 7-like isoform X2 n=1 Tax=Babylonia areolata TaxID=304850 RepID=UPI003FD4EED7
MASGAVPHSAQDTTVAAVAGTNGVSGTTVAVVAGTNGVSGSVVAEEAEPAASAGACVLLREEIEAVEACQWLRAAGFPQYAQMFEDGLFPVDISDVERDHDFLDSDSIQSVIRRLNILNTCSVMKIDAQPCKKAPEESDEEDQCALSSNWEYQKAVRRWSRKLESELSVTEDLNLEPSSSHDSLLGEDSESHTDESPVLESKMPHSTSVREQAPDNVQIHVDADPPESMGEGVIQQDTHGSGFPISPKLRRAASERLKSALKKMESFKKKSKKYPTNRNIVEISDPVVSDQEGMQAKLERLNCVDISPGGGTATPTPRAPPQESTPGEKLAKGPSSLDTSYFPAMSPISSEPHAAPPTSVGDQTINSSTSSQADSSSLSEYYSAHSQLLASFQACSDPNRRPVGPAVRKNSDSSLVEIFLLPQDHKPGSFPRLLKNGYIDTTAPFQGAPNQTSSTSSLPQGVRATAGTGSTPLSSRFSVYDNLSPGSPQHSFPPAGLRRPEDRTGSNLSSSGRQSQVLRSFSSSCGNKDLRTELDMSGFEGMVRSQSASAATSLEHEVVSPRRGSVGVGGGEVVTGGEAQSERDVSMQELDAMLLNLFRDINSLSSDVGTSSQDTLAGSTNTLGGSSTGGQPEVRFTIADHNGSTSTHSAPSNTDSVKEDGQLSQTSTQDGGSLALVTSAPSGGDNSMEVEEGDMSSQDSSEEVEGSADETLERIILEAHERRDSGVGSSLTRASRERTRKKIRWESFQKCHRPSRASRELQIGGLSVCQLLPLRQLSLLKLTSIMEKCSPTNRSQWSWSMPRFMKRHKAPQFSEKNVFGVPFTVMLQRTGQPLPQCVLYAMRYLRKTSHDAIGIFRKSGVRSRIQKLRDMVEACPDTVNFDELQPYDVADLLKQYFRELPECLLTTKLSDTFRSIFSHVPLAQRLEALQTAVVLLPEENREVLHCLLLFLGDIAEHADKHQMNASNLAVCFAPSLFNFLGSHGTNSPKRQRKGLGVPEQRELMEQKAVHECFTYMITECKKLFMVPPSMYSRLHLSTLSNMEPVHLDEFYAKGKQPGPDYKAFGEENIQVLLKEAHDKNRGWAPMPVSVSGIEVMFRKPQDGHPLRQWKCSVEIEAPPIEVLNRILHERHKWDDDMLSWQVVERLDRHCDVFHYVLNSMAPHPPRHFMVLRYWRADLVKGACALVSRSVEHCGWKGATEADYDQGVRAVELGNYHLMEPCGSGRSRLTFISRTDLRGRCPEWYNRVFGHLSSNYLDRLRDSFRQDAEGPETKV